MNISKMIAEEQKRREGDYKNNLVNNRYILPNGWEMEMDLKRVYQSVTRARCADDSPMNYDDRPFTLVHVYDTKNNMNNRIFTYEFHNKDALSVEDVPVMKEFWDYFFYYLNYVWNIEKQRKEESAKQV